MKNVSFFLSLLFIGLILFSCNTQSENVDPNGSNETGFDKPQSVFDGTWLLLETKGFDLNGQAFVKDSTTEGYSTRFEFYESDEDDGKLRTYKDASKDLDYVYDYSASAEQMARKINLDRMMNALPDVYYWEITFVGEETHLFLRNSNYFTDNCCPEKLEHHFILVARAHS